MSAKIAVIGSGISGISATYSLLQKNCEVTIFDQGKNPGGRLGLRSLRSSPYLNRPVDVGAAYFTITSDVFKAQVDKWKSLDLIHEWTDTFHVWKDYEITTTTGPMRHAAKLGFRNLIRHELNELTRKGVTVLQERKISKVESFENKVKVDDEIFDAIVFAMPGVQAAKIINNENIVTELNKQNWQSALSAWIVIDGEIPQYDAMFVNNHEVISLIINDGKRRKDNAPVINVITTSEYAKQRLENFNSYLTEVVDHVLELWNIKSVVAEQGITRWSIAQPISTSRVQMPQNMAIIGDAYDANPRIESAWVDGVAVLNQLADVV
jgi:hypothetical protein